MRYTYTMRRRPSVIFALVAGLAQAAAGGGALARDGFSAPDWRAQAETQGDNVIDIPGIGPIPLPLPPGGRIFGPRGAPQQRPPQTPRNDRKELRERSVAQPRQKGLDALFLRLATTGDAEEARAIANLIRRAWAQSGSDTADLLLSRASIAQNMGERVLALELLTHILSLQPQWSEAFVLRAHVRASLDDVDGALADLEAAIRLEPRRFDAFAALGALEEAKGEKKRALDAYRRSLAIDPKQDDLFKAEEKLRLEVDGRDI
jgi:tetratricopeptide (TPR) repeat protein